MNEYKSAFSLYIQPFISYKKSLNHKTDGYERTLREFDKLMAEYGVTPQNLSQEFVDLVYKQNENMKMITLCAKTVKLIQLCKFINRLGVQCYIPRLPHNREHGYIPYIFTDMEMTKIFEGADAVGCKTRTYVNAVFSIPTIIRLLYATGMRVSEACNLKNADVDLERRTINVLYTKTKLDRVIAINDSLYNLLNQYLSARQRLPLKHIDEASAPFFIDQYGTPNTKKRVYNWFRKILAYCGIEHGGRDYGPRLHDLRHTFAVHSLAKMVKSGKDIYCVLPILSTYLGHKSVSSTEKYIRLTKEMFPDLTESFPEIIISKTISEDE